QASTLRRLPYTTLFRSELVRRIQDQALIEQEQAREHPRLENRALAVLAGHHQARLERRPAAVLLLAQAVLEHQALPRIQDQPRLDRKSTRLNSSHVKIS